MSETVELTEGEVDEIRDAYTTTTNPDILLRIVAHIKAAARREGYDVAVRRVRDAHPNCTDECDMCIARDEMLDDLSDPYPTEETP